MSHRNTVEGLEISFRDCPFEFWAKHSCNDDNDARFRSYSKSYQILSIYQPTVISWAFSKVHNVFEPRRIPLPQVLGSMLSLSWHARRINFGRRSLIAKSECKFAKSRKVSQLFKMFDKVESWLFVWLVDLGWLYMIYNAFQVPALISQQNIAKRAKKIRMIKHAQRRSECFQCFWGSNPIPLTPRSTHAASPASVDSIESFEYPPRTV